MVFTVFHLICVLLFSLFPESVLLFLYISSVNFSSHVFHLFRFPFS